MTWLAWRQSVINTRYIIRVSWRKSPHQGGEVLIQLAHASDDGEPRILSEAFPTVAEAQRVYDDIVLRLYGLSHTAKQEASE